MDKNIQDHRALVLADVARQLEKNRFSAAVAPDRTAALQQVLDSIGPDEIVGFGGSQTVLELGIPDTLAARGQKLLLQKPGMSREEGLSLRRQSLTADVFIGSPNAVTRDGKLYFVDKIGNRAAAMMYGPRKVIAIAGFNKIVTDENAAADRIDTYAAPVNCRRLKLQTPCVQAGRCADCESPDRVCNIAVTLMKKPAYTAYHVILVAEDLGY